MKLKYVSLTGADDDVDPATLSALAQDYPFAEMALLLMPEAFGRPRFPSPHRIEDFKARGRGYHKAMHLCGSALLRFIDGDAEIAGLMAGIGRIQLNLKFGDVEGRYDPAALAARVKSSPQWQFILQYTPDKAGLLSLFDEIPNHAVLFDASAGRGVLPGSWPTPLEGRFCGYAGGIAPDNIEETLPAIAAAAGDYETWIDMESGIRTDDRFDAKKAGQVLAACQPYATCSAGI